MPVDPSMAARVITGVRLGGFLLIAVAGQDGVEASDDLKKALVAKARPRPKIQRRARTQSMRTMYRFVRARKQRLSRRVRMHRQIGRQSGALVMHGIFAWAMPCVRRCAR